MSEDTTDITDEFIDFDQMQPPEEAAPEDDISADFDDELNPYVEIIDMLIQSSGDMLKSEGYPEPNLKIWDAWGKNNLSRAFNAYLPKTDGNISPMACGLIGTAALVLCFMPVILKYIENGKPPEQQLPPAAQAPPAEKPPEKTAEELTQELKSRIAALDNAAAI